MLTAGAGRTEHVHLDVLGTNLHGGIVVQHRNHFQRGKGGLATAGGVEGRDAHQTVDAVLTLQIAIGVFAEDLDGGTLDARLVAVLIVQNIVLIAVALRPAGVQTVQHLGPILRLGAAGTRLEVEDGVLAVVLAGKQGGQTLGLHRLLHLVEALLALLQQGEVLRLVCQLDEGQGVCVVTLQTLVGLDLALDAGGLLGHLLGKLHIVPKAGGRGLGVQLLRLTAQTVQADGAGQILDTGEQSLQF